MTCNCNCKDTGLKLMIKKGESLGFAFILSENDTPIDLTGGNIIFQVRDGLADEGVYVINKTVTENSNAQTIGQINEPSEGKFFIMVTSSETADLSTLKPYFAAIYFTANGIKRCISANSNEVAQLIILNP